MSPAGLELSFSASERPQAHALDLVDPAFSIRSPDRHSVASHYTYYATRAHWLELYIINIRVTELGI